MPSSAASGARPSAPAAAPPPRDELLAALSAAVQETDPHRPLDSIEVLAVRAFLARRGLEHPDGPLPDTLHAWAEWAVPSSPAS